MNYPIVFVPGLFGSLGNDIIPGTGDFDFGLAHYAYRPIIKNLESMGYKEGENLFIAFYNWRKGNSYSAEKYLVPIIDKAKKISGLSKVDIVCHSMGGIVSRAYIQSNYYKYDVNKLIMIGTPNAGSVNAYYFWAGGQLPYKGFSGSTLFKVLWKGFLWIFKRLYRSRSDIEFLRENFSSIGELLPSYEYGNYLYTFGRDNFVRFIPIESMKVQNTFLNNLNRHSYLLYNRGVKVYIISGTGVDTRKYLCVQKKQDSKLWLDGRPIYDIKTKLGDGTVTYNSSTSIYGKKIIVKGDHDDILYKCRNELAKILNKREVFTRFSIKSNSFYSVMVENAETIVVKKSSKASSINGYMDDGEGITIKKVGDDNHWIIIDRNLFKEIKLEIIPRDNTNKKIRIYEIDSRDLGVKVKRVKDSNSYIIKL